MWSWSATMGTYIDKIAKRFGLEDCRKVTTPMEPGFAVTAEDFVEEPTESMVTEMRSLIGSMACCSSRSWDLRWTSMRRNTLRLRIRRVSLCSPLCPFPFLFLVVDPSKGISLCGWLLLGLSLCLRRLLLPFHAPRVCCFFPRRGKILACRLLLLLLRGLLL